MKSRYKDAFTLVELLVVISIMAILAAILLANMASAAKRGRDAQRQADLRNLQTAIEAFKHKTGQYPLAGCGKGDAEWASEGGDDKCVTYIKDLAPDYIAQLPHDPALGDNPGYSYVTNTERSVYKVMATKTVEADTIDYDHPFKSCDIRYGGGTGFPQGAEYNQVDTFGWCSILGTQFSPRPVPVYCFSKNTTDVNAEEKPGNGRFNTSYALWGGFAEGTIKSANGSPQTNTNVQTTAHIICQ